MKNECTTIDLAMLALPPTGCYTGNLPCVFADQAVNRNILFIESMIDAIPNPVFFKDVNGKYKACNNAFAKQIVGLPKHSIKGATVYDLPQEVPRDLADLYHEKDVELIRSPGVQHYEAEVLCTDGLRHVFLFNKTTITDTTGKIIGIMCVMQDITEQKKKEQTLIQVVEGNSIPTFVIDKNHMITHWNRACEKLTGIAADKIIGTRNQWQSFYKKKRPVLADLIVDQADLEDIARYYDGTCRKSDLIESGHEALVFFPNIDRDGKWLFITAAPLTDQSGKIMGAVETIQDLSKEIKTQSALRESENRYRLLAENIADGVAVIQNQKIHFFNEKLLSIIGYDASEIMKIPLRELFRDDYKQHYDDLVTSIKSGIKVDAFTAPYVRKDGRVIWLESRHNMIEWQGKSAVLVTLRDITSMKIREEFLEDESENLRSENIKLRSSIKDRFRLGDIIGKSHPMQSVYEEIIKAAKADASVIITGESGTGKELVAKAIHNLSHRSHMNFVPVNCGAIPEKLLESEFFGYKRGAFSGAHSDKHGYLDLADEGSLFLDELGELEAAMQIKLLRAIDNGGYYPIGSHEMKNSDFRVIAATNRNLKEMVYKGAMREDFFFRLHVISIHLPPLRERKEDIPLLIDHFLKIYGNQQDITTIPGKMLDKLYYYHWPGNIRELQNMLHRYISMGHIEFLSCDPEQTERPPYLPTLSEHRPENNNLHKTIGSVEKEMIVSALDQTNWNRTKASSILGISRRALFRKMENYSLNNQA